MPTLNSITDASFKETVQRALVDVFKTMLSRTTQFASELGDSQLNGSPIVKPVTISGDRLIGTVGFLGELNGLLSLFFDRELAHQCSCQMLGMSSDEVKEAGNEVVNDVIGEITNMTAGTFKNQLADRGFPCKLTIPSIIGGCDLSIEPSKGTARRVYCFTVDSHLVYVDFQLKETQG